MTLEFARVDRARERMRWSVAEGSEEVGRLIAVWPIVAERAPIRVGRRTAHDDLGRDAGEFLLGVSSDLVGALTIRVGDRSIAEELAHEAVARAWADWDRVSAMDDPRAWLFRVGFNLANSHWRRRAARRRADARRTPARPHVQHLGAEVIALAEAVSHLSDQQQRVVILRYYLQYDVAETAAALQVSTGTVKTQTSRALAKLRHLLGDAG